MVLGEQRAGSEELIRFLAEAEAAAAVKHPHVVQVYEYGEADGRPFLAMEYLPGGSLSDWLHRNGRLDPKAAAELLATLAGAVQAAHDLGIVHRDPKPGQILKTLFQPPGERYTPLPVRPCRRCMADVNRSLRT
jgi:serine/threonine protein kinase